jgi:hypothetical protein
MNHTDQLLACLMLQHRNRCHRMHRARMGRFTEIWRDGLAGCAGAAESSPKCDAAPALLNTNQRPDVPADAGAELATSNPIAPAVLNQSGGQR